MKVTESIIVLIYLIVLLVIGYVYRKMAERSERDYWVAGSQAPLWINIPCVVSILISGGSFLGLPGLAYKTGAFFSTLMILGVIVGVALMVMLVGEQYRRAECMTYPDYMYFLFKSNAVRGTAALMFGIYAFGYLIPQFKGGAVTFHYLLGTPFNLSMFIMGAILVIYVMLGGFWAVTWTDFLQGILLYISMILLGIVAIVGLGGLSTIWHEAVKAFPEYGIPKTPWISGFGLFLIWSLAVPTFPANVSRVFASADDRVVRISLVTGIMLYAIFHFITIFVIAPSAIMIAGTTLAKPDMALIVVLQKFFPAIIAGFVAAGILSALMSSADSLLMGFIAVIVHDFYKSLIRPDLTERQTVFYARIVTLVGGIAAVLFSIWTPAIIAIIAGKVAGFAAAALFFPMVVSTWWRRTNRKGALWGMYGGAISYAVLLALDLPLFSEVIYSCIIALVLTIVVSLATGPPSEERLKAFEIVHTPMGRL